MDLRELKEYLENEEPNNVTSVSKPLALQGMTSALSHFVLNKNLPALSDYIEKLADQGEFEMAEGVADALLLIKTMVEIQWVLTQVGAKFSSDPKEAREFIRKIKLKISRY